MKKQQSGFTLIELMIVVAIIGVLAAVAIPSYQSYTARASASEALTALRPLQLSVAEFVQAEGSLPTKLSDIVDYGGYSQSTDYKSGNVASIELGTVDTGNDDGNGGTVQDVRIKITFETADNGAPQSIAGKVLLLEMKQTNGRLELVDPKDSGSDLNPEFRPKI